MAHYIGENKLKNYYYYFPKNKISLRFLPKIVVYFKLHFWYSLLICMYLLDPDNFSFPLSYLICC